MHDDLTAALLLAADGDRQAFERVVRILEPAIVRYCQALVGVEDAPDAAQDSLVRLWLATGRYRGEAPATVYAMAIARRACADVIRAKQRHRRITLRVRDVEQCRTDWTPDETNAHALTDAINALNPDQREAFVLTQIVGCSYDEVAAIADIAIGTVRSRVARAREALAASCSGQTRSA